jgi:hypothetical protein
MMMSRDFLLGEKDAQQTYAMEAHQMLALPVTQHLNLPQLRDNIFRLVLLDSDV